MIDNNSVAKNIGKNLENHENTFNPNNDIFKNVNKPTHHVGYPKS